MSGLLSRTEMEPTTALAVEAVWEIEVDEDRRDPSFDLPLEHAAILATVLPFLGMTALVVTLLVSAVP
jgi:hypothetical protein